MVAADPPSSAALLMARHRWRAGKRQAPLCQSRAGLLGVDLRGHRGRPERRASDAIAAALGDADRRSVAVTLGNMAAIELPPEITKVYLCKENDTAPAAIAAFKCRAGDGAKYIPRRAGKPAQHAGGGLQPWAAAALPPLRAQPASEIGGGHHRAGWCLLPARI